MINTNKYNFKIKRVSYISVFLFLISMMLPITASAQLFDNKENKQLIEKAAKYIYRLDSANSKKAIENVSANLPEHPVVPLMEAVYILWREMPMHTSDSVFFVFEEKLKEVIRKSQKMPDESKAEKIFFEMSARGFLAEHYADEGAYLKALGEAHKTYGFMKDGFKLVSDEPEFLLTSGLYNYFRVAYPEKHPVYKPLLWFFKGGDKEKGLEQLERAVRETIISKVEAHLYLSYIYLRYDRNPEKAIFYLEKLFKLYPENSYFRAKYVEALIEGDQLDKIPEITIQLRNHHRHYYMMSGEVFMGIYEERYKNNPQQASKYFRQAVNRIENLRGHGNHYVSWAYLGLGRFYMNSDPTTAKENLLKAKDYAETKWVKDEAEILLEELK